MSLPALRLLDLSGCAPSLVARSWAAELLAGEGWRVVTIEGNFARDLPGVRARARELGRGVRGVLLPNSFGSALLFRAAGIRSAGFDTDARRWLLAHPLPEPPRMHEVERFWRVALGALAAWGVQPALTDVPRALALKLDARHEENVRRLLGEHRVPARFVLIAPVATGLHRGRTKHWRHFHELIAPLRARGFEPVAMPPAAEADATRTALPGATILPPASLGTYAALAARAAAVVANDSGISHVAAAVGARQVTIFGVTEADRTGPWNPRAVNVGRLDSWPTPADVLAGLDRALSR